MVPPLMHIPKVIWHLKNCRAKGIMVFPRWPSSRFWPFLYTPNGPIPKIKKQRIVKNGASIIIPGKHVKSVFTPAKLKSAMMAVLLDASSELGQG